MSGMEGIDLAEHYLASACAQFHFDGTHSGEAADCLSIHCTNLRNLRRAISDRTDALRAILASEIRA